MTGASSSSVFVNCDTANEPEIPMVWKVKRRPDGSRYIVKRPARSQISQVEIRRNAEKIKPDDYIMSNLKLGRYCTKEERRRHIERTREKRQHQVQPQQQ